MNSSIMLALIKRNTSNRLNGLLQDGIRINNKNTSENSGTITRISYTIGANRKAFNITTYAV